MVKIRNKLTALLAVLLLLTGCTEGAGTASDTSSGSQTEGKVQDFALGWATNETVNPYKTVSKLNQELGLLMYDGLYAVSPDFTPVARLAASCSSADGRNYYVTINPAAVFTNGVSVTADDVVYSCALAKKSATAGFKDMLSDISSYTVVDFQTVCFTLRTVVPSFESVLVFPIIQSGTDVGETAYGTDATPVGTGRYLFHRSYGEAWLTSNSSWCAGPVSISRIELVDVPDEESLEYYNRVGKISVYYTDLSDEILPSYSGEYLKVNLRNAVFLGFNSENELLEDRMRRAISYCIDRQELVTSAYYSQALAANGIFSPARSDTAGFQSLSTGKQAENARQILYELGYTESDETGHLLGSDGSPLTFRILCNSESSSRCEAARIISDSAALLGITLTVETLPKADYLEAIKTDDFDLYIGELKLNSNFDLTALLNIYGVGSESAGAGTWKKYKNGSATISDFIAAQNGDLSVAALLYRCGVVIVTGRLKGLTPSSTDIYYNIQSCSLA